MTQVAELETTIEITAPPAQVWALVSDVRRMADWSPQVDSTRLRDGADAVALGTRFTNRNVHGELVWITHAEVVRFEPEREIAFRVEENWTTWSFALTPTTTGTRLTQRRETPEGISDLSAQLIEGFMGGHDAFAATMRTGTCDTLAAIKAAAEG